MCLLLEVFNPNKLPLTYCFILNSEETFDRFTPAAVAEVSSCAHLTTDAPPCRNQIVGSKIAKYNTCHFFWHKIRHVRLQQFSKVSKILVGLTEEQHAGAKTNQHQKALKQRGVDCTSLWRVWEEEDLFRGWCCRTNAVFWCLWLTTDCSPALHSLNYISGNQLWKTYLWLSRKWFASVLSVLTKTLWGSYSFRPSAGQVPEWCPQWITNHFHLEGWEW